MNESECHEAMKIKHLKALELATHKALDNEELNPVVRKSGVDFLTLHLEYCLALT